MSSRESVRLAIDMASGDRPVDLRLDAACRALREDATLHLQLHGMEQNPLPADLRQRASVRAGRAICMDDAITPALLRSESTAMAGALMALRDGAADACLSAGNTAALVAISRRLLGCAPPLRRPAMAAAIPHLRGTTWLLDSGANLRCTPVQLVQFARLGQSLADRPRPRTGLLNIGKEAIKGTADIKRADQLLRGDDTINYCGFAEADDLLTGRFDIVICDGLLGNVSLKAVEGTARYLADILRLRAQRPLLGPVLGWLLRPLQQQIEPARFNGAILLGARGLVVKSHGNAGSTAFLQAIRYTARTVRSS